MLALLALGAVVLSLIGGYAAVIDRDWTIAPYFLVTAIAAGVVALLLAITGSRWPLLLARMIGAIWILAGAWIGILLGVFQVTCGCSGPPPVRDPTLLGVPVTIVHLVATFGSLALIVIATFGGWHRVTSTQGPDESDDG